MEIKMKKTKVLSLLLAVFLLLSSLTLPLLAVDAETAEDPEQTQSDGADAAAADDSVPEDQLLSSRTSFSVAAKAALLVDLNTGRTVYEQDADERIYPASLTKIMTCLLALENGNLSDVVTVSASALEDLDIDSSVAGLQVGEQMTLENLLYCMMVVSGNDACNVIAEHIAGSITDFVRMMNQRAYELGCLNTHFSNPHGLHDENHYTTAADMAKIAAAAMESDTFRSICSTAQVTIPATNLSGERTLSTTNYMLPGSANPGYAYEGTIGIKTGFTTPAGCCLVAACTKDGRTLLSVVFGAQKTYDENGVEQVGSFPQTQALMDWGFTNYETITAYQAALNAPPEESPDPTASPEESAAEDEAAVSAAPEASDAPSAQVSASAQQETEEESSGIGHVFGTLLLLVAIIIVVLLLLIVLFLLIMMLKRG